MAHRGFIFVDYTDEFTCHDYTKQVPQKTYKIIDHNRVDCPHRSYQLIGQYVSFFQDPGYSFADWQSGNKNPKPTKDPLVVVLNLGHGSAYYGFCVQILQDIHSRQRRRVQNGWLCCRLHHDWYMEATPLANCLYLHPWSAIQSVASMFHRGNITPWHSTEQDFSSRKIIWTQLGCGSGATDHD